MENAKTALNQKPTKAQKDGIYISKARQNNLKDISVFIPRDKMTVITGLSGSGKSSLAFDVLFAEGQRSYMKSLSHYGRQFVEHLEKPDVDSIFGMSPAIAINQKTLNNHPRSTVGTMSESYDYLRLLFAKKGEIHCPKCQIPLEVSSLSSIASSFFKLKKSSKVLVSAIMAEGKKGEFLNEFRKWMKEGFSSAKVNGSWKNLEDLGKLKKTKKHHIDLLIDRLSVDIKFKDRLYKALEFAQKKSFGVRLEVLNSKKIYSFFTHKSCKKCSYSAPELEPRHFSFNTPVGACSSCDGIGYESFEEYDEETGDSEYTYQLCESCHGARLNENFLNVFIDGKNIYDFSSMSISSLINYLEKLEKRKFFDEISSYIVKDLKYRLTYIEKVGAGYLSLSRSLGTLSGGEAQRIRLASQMGVYLTGVTYVLDEPSIGLHPKDHMRLLEVMKEVQKRNNTLVVVEHDKSTILSADYLIDVGPGAGKKGGHLCYEGPIQKIKSQKDSSTIDYLMNRKKIEIPKNRRKISKDFIEVKGACGNNLKKINVKFPLGNLIGVTGVSGSGKSSLVTDTLYKGIKAHFSKKDYGALKCEKITQLSKISKVVQITQKPIGKTSRSTPSTYVGLFDLIRHLYAGLLESKVQGYKAGFFSFNVNEGRCSFCEGKAQIKHQVPFLSDVYSLCPVCKGRRYGEEVESVSFKGKTIADVLQMNVAEALDFFENQKLIAHKLKVLKDMGLSYLQLGQSSTSLSGGEAQRIKLAKQLSKKISQNSLFIFDEPTTGLHFEDVKNLIKIFHQIVDQGNTVIVIEHHMDVIKNCEYLIDIGPDSGDKGGRLIFQGDPLKLIKEKKGQTYPYLKEAFDFS